MKIVLAGKSFCAVDTLRYLADINETFGLGLTICAVVAKSDHGIDTWEPSLGKAARDLGIETFDDYREVPWQPGDILLSVQYDKIVKTENLNGARPYNLHFAALPLYRGCHTSVLPIRHGADVVGVTLHEMTDGIDTGAIIDQILFPLYPFFDSLDLYLAYNAHGFEVVKRNLQGLVAGSYYVAHQGEGTYFDRHAVDYGDREITNFARPAVEVHNHIRSLMFEPYQLPTYKGRTIKRCDVVDWLGNGTGFEGKTSAVVKCADGFIRLELGEEC